jgi:DNA-binding NarL/FixJ family response regulator
LLPITAESKDTNPPLRVLVVDDDPLVRRTIRDELGRAGLIVVGEADDGREAVRAARDYKPDIVLLDAVLPGIDGMTALERMVADERVRAKIVLLSVRGERDLGYLALRKGAAGYLNKELDLRALPQILRDVARGGAAVSRTLTADIVRRIRELPEAPLGMCPVRSVLTTREWEVIDQMCLGHPVTEIADALVLSVETVRTHLKNIMRKLEVHSRAEAIEAASYLRASDGVPNAPGSRTPARRAGGVVRRLRRSTGPRSVRHSRSYAGSPIRGEALGRSEREASGLTADGSA